jgi:hypothetical protein
MLPAEIPISDHVRAEPDLSAGVSMRLGRTKHRTMTSPLAAICRTAVSAALIGVAMCAIGVTAAGAQSTSSLSQKLSVSWRNDNRPVHARATFAIPGIGAGEVVCKPNTTWIRMLPADTGAENSMWTVKFQTKNGVAQSAVKDVRVYKFSTPTSTVPHGTGPTAYEGFNQDTPIEPADTGSMVGLISKRGALNAPGGAGVAPTSFQLSWNWTGFGTPAARCNVNATFITRIVGRSRSVSNGRPSKLPNSLSPAFSFNVNWHGQAEVAPAATRPHSLAVPRIGKLAATCQTGIAGQSYLTLTPAPGASPFASVAAYQGEGIHNSVQTDYYTDPTAGLLGPIPLPVNGMLVATLLPAWQASPGQAAQLVVSSLRKTNDPDPRDNYCEISAQVVGPS